MLYWCKGRMLKKGDVKMLDGVLEQQRRRYQQAGSVWDSCSDWIPALTSASAGSHFCEAAPSRWAGLVVKSVKGHRSSLVVGNSQCSSQSLYRYMSIKPTTPNIILSAGHAHDAAQVISCFHPSAITTSRLPKIWHWYSLPGEGHLKVIARYTCGHKPCTARHCAYQKREVPKEKCSEALLLLEYYYQHFLSCSNNFVHHLHFYVLFLLC